MPEDAAARGAADLLRMHGCATAYFDPLDDLCVALEERSVQENRAGPRFPRYLVWGDRPD